MNGSPQSFKASVFLNNIMFINVIKIEGAHAGLVVNSRKCLN